MIFHLNQQTIHMRYEALFVIFEKNNTIWKCHLLHVRGGALRVNINCNCVAYIVFLFDCPLFLRNLPELSDHMALNNEQWVN